MGVAAASVGGTFFVFFVVVVFFGGITLFVFGGAAVAQAPVDAGFWLWAAGSWVAITPIGEARSRGDRYGDGSKGGTRQQEAVS